MAPQHIAVSDCERVRAGPVAQPANTMSSLAYCAVGGWIGRHARHDGTGARWRIVGAASVVVGLGSAAYHGPGGPASRRLHDGSNVALAAAVVTALIRSGPAERPRLLVLAGACAGVGLAVHSLSRTGGPLCRPDSPLQAHALWHVLGAGAVLSAGAAHLTPAGPR